MINNVLLVGLGGVGAVYASKIPNINILVDYKRLDYYKKKPIKINNIPYKFNYITPDNTEFKADLIIITVKYNNLRDVLQNIQNFISSNTKIISLVNGIDSENIIAEFFPRIKVIKSYLLCNSIIRIDRSVQHDNVNKIVLEQDDDIIEFFKRNNINYEVVENISTSMWQKFMLNIVANQLSAVTRMSFGEMNKLPYIDYLLNAILKEVILIAKAEGINEVECLAERAIKTFKTMAPYGKTSMLQDVENFRETELEAFAGTIIKMGKKHRISTPYNTLFYWLINK